MQTKLLLLLLAVIATTPTYAQDYFEQYFDGADTLYNSLIIELDTTNNNVWQIGPPQKNIFGAAATAPNVLITDTINYYPTNNNSSFHYYVYSPDWWGWGILAIQWKQKLDMDAGQDGGIIEFSVDGGTNWENAFNNPYVYNFYGFNNANVDTLVNGEMAFTGTDSLWRDMWLCYDMAWLNQNDSLMVRHTLVTDSIDNNKEGWMIDNLMAHITIIHTVEEIKQEKYLTVAPNPTTGRVYISAKKINEYHIIEKMELLNTSGQLLDQWKNIPTKFFIDIDDHPDGIYFLKVKTNKESETFKIVLQKTR